MHDGAKLMILLIENSPTIEQMFSLSSNCNDEMFFWHNFH